MATDIQKREPTKADLIYEKYRKELEREHFGKIVAIDTDLEKIVGIGYTILEAYKLAQKETGKNQFNFKRVGYDWVHEIYWA